MKVGGSPARASLEQSSIARLLLAELQNALFHGGPHDQAQEGERAAASDAVGSEQVLGVEAVAPVRVVHKDHIHVWQVRAQPTRPRVHQQQEGLTAHRSSLLSGARQPRVVLKRA